jgi:hypothetical protein
MRVAAIVAAFVVAAILTPPDPISQLGLALPTVLLYEVSIWLAKRVERGDPSSQDAPHQAIQEPLIARAPLRITSHQQTRQSQMHQKPSLFSIMRPSQSLRHQQMTWGRCQSSQTTSTSM